MTNVAVAVTELPKTVEEAKAAIVEYFSRPGAKLAKAAITGCYYRHPEDGRACAVGCILPDSIGEAIASDPEKRGLYVGYLDLFEDGPLLRFLVHAQIFHDDSDTVEEFLSKLNKIPH